MSRSGILPKYMKDPGGQSVGGYRIVSSGFQKDGIDHPERKIRAGERKGIRIGIKHRLRVPAENVCQIRCRFVREARSDEKSVSFRNEESYIRRFFSYA